MENALNQIAFQGTLYIGLLEMQLSSRIVKVNRSFWSVAALHFYILSCVLCLLHAVMHMFLLDDFAKILVFVEVQKCNYFSLTAFLCQLQYTKSDIFLGLVISRSSMESSF